MKTLKLIILSLLVFAGEKMVAQNITVTNNTLLAGGAAAFHFTSCPIISVPFPIFGSQTQTNTCSTSVLSQVVVTFNDPSCAPTLKTITIPAGTLPAVVTYTGCAPGFVTYSFTLDLVGADWTLDIL